MEISSMANPIAFVNQLSAMPGGYNPAMQLSPADMGMQQKPQRPGPHQIPIRKGLLGLLARMDPNNRNIMNQAQMYNMQQQQQWQMQQLAEQAAQEKMMRDMQMVRQHYSDAGYGIEENPYITGRMMSGDPEKYYMAVKDAVDRQHALDEIGAESKRDVSKEEARRITELLVQQMINEGDIDVQVLKDENAMKRLKEKMEMAIRNPSANLFGGANLNVNLPDPNKVLGNEDKVGLGPGVQNLLKVLGDPNATPEQISEATNVARTEQASNTSVSTVGKGTAEADKGLGQSIVSSVNDLNQMESARNMLGGIVKRMQQAQLEGRNITGPKHFYANIPVIGEALLPILGKEAHEINKSVFQVILPLLRSNLGGQMATREIEWSRDALFDPKASMQDNINRLTIYGAGIDARLEQAKKLFSHYYPNINIEDVTGNLDDHVQEWRSKLTPEQQKNFDKEYGEMNNNWMKMFDEVKKGDMGLDDMERIVDQLAESGADADVINEFITLYVEPLEQMNNVDPGVGVEIAGGDVSGINWEFPETDYDNYVEGIVNDNNMNPRQKLEKLEDELTRTQAMYRRQPTEKVKKDIELLHSAISLMMSGG